MAASKPSEILVPVRSFDENPATPTPLRSDTKRRLLLISYFCYFFHAQAETKLVGLAQSQAN